MTPISSVAAITPKVSAARSPGLLSLMRPPSSYRLAVGRIILSGASILLVSCSEPTQPARRFGILDDEGQGNWQTVSVGSDHSCGIKADGTAYCWGSDQYGQLGIVHGDTLCGPVQSRYRCSPIPRSVQPGLELASVSAGAEHTCAITIAGDAYCWGANDQGQLGDLSTGGPTLVRVPAPGGLPWVQISAGFSHTCAVRSDGVVFCWGSNDRGQLGNGTFVGGIGPARVKLPSPMAAVSAGQSRTCARTTTGGVYCWGAVWLTRDNGLEITRAQPTPQAVPGAPAMAWLSVGTLTTCAAATSGFAYCWEANVRGEMGTGNQTGSTLPEQVASPLEFVQVSAGIVQTCGVSSSGAGYCWGDDSFGQLGVLPSLLVERCGGQQLPCATTPVAVFGRQRFIEISTGFGSHSCGVTTQRNLYCWGLGESGQRGDGIIGGAASTPATVVEPTR